MPCFPFTSYQIMKPPLNLSFKMAVGAVMLGRVASVYFNVYSTYGICQRCTA